MRRLVESALGVGLEPGRQAEDLDAPPAGIGRGQRRRVEGGEDVGAPAGEALLSGGDQGRVDPLRGRRRFWSRKAWRHRVGHLVLLDHQRPEGGRRRLPCPRTSPATTLSAVGSAWVRRLSRKASSHVVLVMPPQELQRPRRGSGSARRRRRPPRRPRDRRGRGRARPADASSPSAPGAPACARPAAGPPGPPPRSRARPPPPGGHAAGRPPAAGGSPARRTARRSCGPSRRASSSRARARSALGEHVVGQEHLEIGTRATVPGSSGSSDPVARPPLQRARPLPPLPGRDLVGARAAPHRPA